MGRNFGERRKNKKKQNQKPKSKPTFNVQKTLNDMDWYPGPLQETVTCREVAIYVPKEEKKTTDQHRDYRCTCKDCRSKKYRSNYSARNSRERRSYHIDIDDFIQGFFSTIFSEFFVDDDDDDDDDDYDD